MKKELIKYLTILNILIISMSVSAQINITGSISVCNGEVGYYEITNSQTNTNYTWSVNTSSATIIASNNQAASIQWNGGGLPYTYYTITVTDGILSSSLTVSVTKIDDPYFTFENEVECQNLTREGNQSNLIIDESDECIKVCENSQIEYTAHGTPYYSLDWSTYEWSVIGGVFTEVYVYNNQTNQHEWITLAQNTTYIQAGYYYYTDNFKVRVLWGNVGSGSLSLTEYNWAGFLMNPSCPPKSFSHCFTIIEKPIANFLADDLKDWNKDDCYEICKNHTVNFKDLSMGSFDSQIIDWLWDFGDGSAFSHLQNPTHTYNNPGNYIVKLIVTNECGCKSEFVREICVDKLEGPNIYCTAIECEEGQNTYQTDADCGIYNWTVKGGQIINNSGKTVSVKWNEKTNLINGFGYLTLNIQDCPELCTNPVTLKVPVVYDGIPIIGPVTTCMDESYVFNLPEWPATNFTWSLDNNTNGATIMSYSENDHLVHITTGSVQGSFDLICEYENTVSKCSGTSKITVNVRLKPAISGNLEICSVNPTCTLNISTPPVPSGVTTWTIVDPLGNISAPIQSAFGSNTIVLSGTSLFPNIGTYTVYAKNNSNFCDPDPVNISVVDPPSPPTSIIGDVVVCPNYPIEYSSEIIIGTLLNWTTSNGVIIDPYSSNTPTSLISNLINATWNTNSPKSLTVNREWENIPGCKSSDFSVSISNIILTGSITGSTAVGVDETETYTINISNGLIAEIYFWEIVPSNAGSILSGQGTDNISIQWNSSSNTSAVIHCKLSKCNIITNSNTANPLITPLQVTILSNAQVTTLIADNYTICAGSNVNFTATSQGIAPNTYVWDFGDGTITNQQNSNSTSSIAHSFINLSNSTITRNVCTHVLSGASNTPSVPVCTTITVNPQPAVYMTPSGYYTYVAPLYTPLVITAYSNISGCDYTWWFKEEGTNYTGAILGATILNNVNSSYSYNINPSSIPVFAQGPQPTSINGQYWCVITNNYSCASITNKLTVKEASTTSGSQNSTGNQCTPAGIHGITNTTSHVNCNSAYVTCNTLSDAGDVNIINYQWSISPAAASLNTTNQSKNQSPVYTFDHTGDYVITLYVDYVDANNPNQICTSYKMTFITIDKIADFQYDIICNGNNNGYIIDLMNYSDVYPGYPITGYQWKVNGTTVSSNSSYTISNGSPNTTYVVELSITNSVSTCSTSKSFTTPSLPIANYTVNTTPGGSGVFESCEGNLIDFINLSTPSNNILKYEWNFDDGSKSFLENPEKVYDVNSGAFKYPSLKITDKNGCISYIMKQLYVNWNNLSGNYSPVSREICQDEGLSSQNGITANISNGTSPYSYSWFMEEYPIGLNYNVLQGANIGQGAYWVRITDAKGCIKDINPTAAIVIENPKPTAAIYGKQDICYGNNLIELTAYSGLPDNQNFSYIWNLIINSTNTYTFYGKRISVNPTTYFQSGIYSFDLTISDGVCQGQAFDFEVNVHNQPVAPIISTSIINCDEYKIELIGAAPTVSNPLFNWSTGSDNAITNIYSGGIYRLWVTDENGCRSHTDIDIPKAPSYYFWRFPYGCYDFCPNDLPVSVDGPFFIDFDSWQWYHDGNAINNNGGLASSGTNSPVNTLTIDLPNNGEGSGDYSWKLENEFCEQTTGVMSVTIDDCCELPLRLDQVSCTSMLYSFQLTIENVPCNNATFEIQILDANGNPAGTNAINITPNIIMYGSNQIYFDLPAANINSSYIIIKIIVKCDKEICEAMIEADLPHCEGDKRIGALSDSISLKIPQKYLTIIPNPANSYVSIIYSLNQENASDYKLLLIDAMGKTLEELPLSNSIGKFILNVERYQSGFYYIQLRNNKMIIETRKVIISR
jgi:PKD repeat protein